MSSSRRRERGMRPRKNINDVVIDVERHQLTWAQLQGGKFEDGDCGNSLEKPMWFDEEKYLRGQMLLKDNLASSMFCHLAGLIMGIAIELPYTVLANSGNHNNLKDLASRYISTSDKIIKWYSTDIFDPTSEGAKNLALVRKMHAASHRAMNNNRFLARPQSGELWMSQFYMSTTQISFVGFMMIFSKSVGVAHFARSDKEAVIHYWRCIGYLLGISDKYNACGRSVEGFMTLTTAFIENLLRPSMLQITPDKYNLVRGIMDSVLVSTGNKFVTRNGFMMFWCKLLGVEFNEKLHITDHVSLFLIRCVYSSRLTSIGFVRKFLNHRYERRYLNALKGRNDLSDSPLDKIYDHCSACPYLMKKRS